MSVGFVAATSGNGQGVCRDWRYVRFSNQAPERYIEHAKQDNETEVARREIRAGTDRTAKQSDDYPAQ